MRSKRPVSLSSHVTIYRKRPLLSALHVRQQAAWCRFAVIHSKFHRKGGYVSSKRINPGVLRQYHTCKAMQVDLISHEDIPPALPN